MRRLCEVCQREPAVWHTVTIIDHGRHEIHGDVCEECGDDMSYMVDSMVLL